MKGKLIIIVVILAVIIGTICYAFSQKEDTPKEMPVKFEKSDNVLDGVGFSLNFPAVATTDSENLSEYAEDIESFTVAEYVIPGFKDRTYRIIVGRLNEIDDNGYDYDNVCNFFNRFKDYVVETEEPSIEDGVCFKGNIETASLDTFDCYIYPSGLMVLAVHPKGTESIHIYDIHQPRNFGVEGTKRGNENKEDTKSTETPITNHDKREATQKAETREKNMNYIALVEHMLKEHITYDKAMYKVCGDVKVMQPGTIFHDTPDVSIEVNDVYSYDNENYVALCLRVSNRSETDLTDMGNGVKGYGMTGLATAYFDDDMENPVDAMAVEKLPSLCNYVVRKGQAVDGYLLFPKPKGAKKMKVVYTKLLEIITQKSKESRTIEGEFAVDNLFPTV